MSLTLIETKRRAEGTTQSERSRGEQRPEAKRSGAERNKNASRSAKPGSLFFSVHLAGFIFHLEVFSHLIFMWFFTLTGFIFRLEVPFATLVVFFHLVSFIVHLNGHINFGTAHCDNHSELVMRRTGPKGDDGGRAQNPTRFFYSP